MRQCDGGREAEIKPWVIRHVRVISVSDNNFMNLRTRDRLQTELTVVDFSVSDSNKQTT